MDKALYTHCLGVLRSASASDFSNHVSSFIQGLGFSRFAATVITDHSPQLTEFQTVTNAPSAFLDDFHDLDKAVLDPVSQHCKHNSSVIVWNQMTYTTPGMGAVWESQAPFGYKYGVATGVHYQKGRHFMFGASGLLAPPKDSIEFRRVVGDFQTFTAYAQAAAFELCLHSKTKGDRDLLLSGPDIDALRWTMDGKTVKGVALSMCTSEEVAAFRLRSTMEKLGCGTKYEAVLKAIRLGLIQCN